MKTRTGTKKDFSYNHNSFNYDRYTANIVLKTEEVLDKDMS